MVELPDLLGRCGCSNMVWVVISNQERSNFVNFSLKPATRADEHSLVNQCSHKMSIQGVSLQSKTHSLTLCSFAFD